MAKKHPKHKSAKRSKHITNPRTENNSKGSEPKPMKVNFYTTAQGKCPYDEFLATLKDKKAKQKLISRLARIEHSGHLGDFEKIDGPIIELRIHYGEGYRIYCVRRGQELMIILTAGSKSTQSRDIQKAKIYWNEYQSSQNS